MEKELGLDVIKSTQSALGKYVKRPPLSEKLLRKPPFRFLHDIVTAVLKTTGFFNGLFEDNELISENVKDRESKIIFLSKVISVISATTGKSISAKPSKIVAGQEPEKTNELLLCLAYALDNNLSSDEAVQNYKEKGQPSPPKEIKSKENTDKKKNDTTKLTSKSTEKLTSNKKESVNKIEKSKLIDPKPKKKDSDVAKIESQPKKVPNMKTVSRQSSIESKVSQPTKTNSQRDKNVTESNLDTDRTKSKTTESLDLNATDQTLQKPNYKAEDLENELGNTPKHTYDEIIPSQEPSQDLYYAEHQEERKSNENKTNVKDVKQTAELDRKDSQENEKEVHIKDTNHSNDIPTDESLHVTNNSANSIQKPRHEKTVLNQSEVNENEHSITNNKIASNSKQNSEISRPPSVRPSSSRPGAPRLREKIENIVNETENLLLAKVNIIAENTQNEEEDDSSVIIVDQIELGSNANDQSKQFKSSNEHGHLVQQILDSQKELNIAGKTEIEWQFGAQKAMETINQEIEQLRYNIQALSRVANPLGKLLDHVQEDVEIMRQELQQWTNVYEEVSKDMIKQKTASEETLVPLQSRIKQLNLDIDEKRDKINDLKIMIHKNSTRIGVLLSNGNVQ